MKRILPFTLLFLCLAAFADTKAYSFKVLDHTTNGPIDNAFIRVVNLNDNKVSGAASDSMGLVALNLDVKNRYRIDVGKRTAEKNVRYITYSFFLDEQEIVKNTVTKVMLEKVKVNSEITLSNLYFDFERTELNGQDKIVLSNTLIALKNSPSLQIEIGIHADCNESAEVAAKRQEAIVSYFANKGDLAKRVVIKNYGKESQLAGCNCSSPVIYSDQVYSLNRVAEFKVLTF